MVRLHSAQRQGYKSGETVGDHLKQLDMVRLHSAQMQGFLLVSLIKIKIIYINLVGDHIYIYKYKTIYIYIKLVIKSSKYFRHIKENKSKLLNIIYILYIYI